jgi:membrane-bound lytic murein transglycosylase D
MFLLLQLSSCANYQSRFIETKGDKDLYITDSASISLKNIFTRENFNFLRKDKKSIVGLVENREVKKWINYFSIKHKKMFVRYLVRGAPYKKMIERELRREKMPIELYYLAMIESGFVYNAKSKAKAVGIWQLIDGTARRYGLRVDKYVDERYDPRKATRAAIQYLKDLHNVYQSWPLAIAAYNSGERRVLNAIMISNNRDFWDIIKKKRLPKETMEYVPKFMAAVIIGNDYNRFSIDQKLINRGLRKKISRDYLKLVMKKRYVAKKLHRKYRPGVIYKRGITLSEVTKKKKVVISKLKNAIHMVTRGERLIDISRAFKISVIRLKKINRLRSDKLYVGQIIKLPRI